MRNTTTSNFQKSYLQMTNVKNQLLEKQNLTVKRAQTKDQIKDRIFYLKDLEH